MRRGDIFLAELQPRSGAEIRGERPVLVVQHDGFNRIPTWQSVTVVPLSTSTKQVRRGPTVVVIPDGVGGLRGEGVAVCHQITTLDRSKITRRLGALPAEWMGKVEAGIRAGLDLG